jgi:hypothetical protein
MVNYQIVDQEGTGMAEPNNAEGSIKGKALSKVSEKL